jgi:hypothetical protein
VNVYGSGRQWGGCLYAAVGTRSGAGRASDGVSMSDSHDQRALARRHADLMALDLECVSGLLEEVATLWRRAERYGQQPSSASPGSLQDTARSLADSVRTLPDVDCEQQPALAFLAVAQLVTLESNAALSAAATGGIRHGDAGIWAAISRTLGQVREQLWSLMFWLACIREASLTEGAKGAPGVSTAQEWPEPPAASLEESRRALATQRAGVDALPEAELRPLLALLGGMDPAALQQAAAAYTETFGAVDELQASVAALRQVAPPE